MKKRSDMTRIKSDTPRVVSKAMYPDRGDVVHIVEEIGYYDYTDVNGRDQARTYYLTNCGRVAAWHGELRESWWHGVVTDSSVLGGERLKMCARCGDAHAFRAAQSAYNRELKEINRKRELEKMVEEVESEWVWLGRKLDKMFLEAGVEWLKKRAGKGLEIPVPLDVVLELMGEGLTDG